MKKNDVFSAKKVLLNASVYSFTGILQKAISFFLLPLYTIYLTPNDYGLTDLISSFSALVSLLITLGLNGAVSRYYFIYKDDEKKIKEFIGTIILAVIFNCVLWFSLLCLFNQVIIKIFLPNIKFYPYVFIGLISTATAPIYLLYQSILQIKQEARRYSINSMCYFILTLSLNIILVAVLKIGALGLLLAAAIPSLLFCIFAIVSLYKNKHVIIAFKWKYLKEASFYSLPLLPHLVSGTIANYISKNILNLKSTLASVGLFNIASQFGSIIDIFQASINSAYVPWFYDTMDNNREEMWKVIKVTTYILKGLCFLGLGLSLFSKEIVYIMTSNKIYHSAWIAIPIIVLATLFNSLYIFYGNTLFYNKRATKYIWIASLSGNLIHIFLSILLTSYFGFITPAIALLIQILATALIVYFISRIVEPVEFELFNMLCIILLFICATSVGLCFDFLNYNSNINIFIVFFKIVVFVLSGIILMYKERLIILGFLQKKLKRD